MVHIIKIGTMIYHESRYWKTDNLQADEVLGWNARYLPYVVVNVTPKTFYCMGAGTNGETSKVQIPRGERPKRPGHCRHEHLEADGRQYHSRFHEYFYVEIPKAKPLPMMPMTKYAHALLLLGLVPPVTTKDVTTAYKRLALKAHPDQGGQHEDFIRLKNARDVALRGF